MKRTRLGPLAAPALLIGLGAGCGSAPTPAVAVAPAAPPPSAKEVAPVVPPPRDDGRLPGGVTPVGYRWELEVDPGRAGFSGHVFIDVRVSEATRAIVLHGRGPRIRSARITSPTGAWAAAAQFRPDAHPKGQADELVLTTDHAVPPGEATIDIVYEAPFADGLSGLYRVEDGGKSFAFTQFEPVGARLAMPCFDEPGDKVPFEVSVRVPKGDLALSNMPEVKRTPSADGAWETFDFARSPPLPTYLLALGVGPIELREGAPAGPVPIRLGSAPGRAAMGGFALATAKDHLGILESYFGMPYPYPKLDLLAVPNFGSGAMENAGLVTFREERVLLDPRASSTALRRGVAGVIAHELAHMWFGDLVTLAWWNDIWLNEGFATWAAARVLDTWRPDMEAGVDQLTQTALVLDGDTLASARKVRQPVRSTTEAFEAFDGITYDKGAALLAMVERWITPQVFQKGVRAYLAEHRFGNATAGDLFTALGAASGQDVAGVLGSFTEQTGVPAVELSPCRLEGGRPTMDVTEREYRPLGTAPATGKRWKLPVCVHVGGAGEDARVCTSIEGEPARLTLPGGACPGWVHPNADQAGYYRSTQSLEALTALARLPRSALTVRERVGVLLDAWALVEAGTIAAGDFLALAERFRGDPEQAVWQRIVESLEFLDEEVLAPDQRGGLAAFASRLLQPEARALGWEARPGERDGDRMRRRLVLEGLGRVAKDKDTLAKAAGIAARWLDKPDSVDPDAATIALPLVAAGGDPALFARFEAHLREAKTPAERVLALSAIAGFSDPALVRRALDLVVNGTVRTQDQLYVFRGLFGRSASRAPAFEFVSEHADELLAKVPPTWRGRAIPWLARSCSQAGAEAAQALFQPRLASMEGADRGLALAIDTTHRCAAIREHHAPALQAWLAQAAERGGR